MNMPQEKPKPTFAQIQEEIANMLEVSGEEMTEDEKLEMDKYLNELADQEAAKIDGFSQFIKLESERARNYRDESQRLASKARSAERRIGYLKEKYLGIMQAHDLKKVKGNIYTLSIHKSEAVDVPDVFAVPDEFWRIRDPEPNKDAIKAALKEGRDIPGARLKISESLQIR